MAQHDTPATGTAIGGIVLGMAAATVHDRAGGTRLLPHPTTDAGAD